MQLDLLRKSAICGWFDKQACSCGVANHNDIWNWITEKGQTYMEIASFWDKILVWICNCCRFTSGLAFSQAAAE